MTYRWFRARRGRALTAFVLGVPAMTGCYEYVPLASATPAVGQNVSVEITDAGRVQLSDRFGSGLTEIEGRIQAAQADQFIMNVYKVSHIGGESALWTGETVRLQRSYVGITKGRELSRTRTTLLAVTAAVVVVGAITTAHLAGVFNGPTEEPTPTPPLSVRIPIRARP
jgi:hypothetical protein